MVENDVAYDDIHGDDDVDDDDEMVYNVDGDNGNKRLPLIHQQIHLQILCSIREIHS